MLCHSLCCCCPVGALLLHLLLFLAHTPYICASLAAHGVFGALVCASLAPRTNPDSHDFSGLSLCPILATFSLSPVGWPVGQQRFVHRYLSTCKPPRGRLFAIAVQRLSTWCKIQLILPWVPLCERAVVANARHLWHD